MSQNTVIYLAVDKDGGECIFNEIPIRVDREYWWYSSDTADLIELPTGTIKKLTGKDLTWGDGYRVYTSDDYDPTPE